MSCARSAGFNIFSVSGAWIFYQKMLLQSAGKTLEISRGSRKCIAENKTSVLESMEGSGCRTVLLSLYCSHNGDADNRNNAKTGNAGIGNCYISGHCLVLFHGFSVRGKGNQKSDYRSDRKKSGQRFLRIYDALEQQKQVLILLARNSELEGNMAKAEGYYRQMLREKAGSKEYSLYGLFLIRQGREKESVELYKLMKNRKDLKSDSDYAKDVEHWKEYLKQLSVLKGEETKYDLK